MGRTPIALLVVLSATTIHTQDQRAAPPAPTGTGAIAGRALDAQTNEPLVDATVSVTANTPAWPRRDVQTDQNGSFVIRDMPAGNFVVSAKKTGYAYSSFGERFPEDATQWFDLGEGEQARDVTIRAWKTAAVSGRVVDAAGQPVPGVAVQPRRVTSEGNWRMLTSGGRGATTDRDGVYRLTDLPPGNFAIAVPTVPTDGAVGFGGAGAIQATLGYPTSYFPGVVPAGGAEILTLAPGEERRNINITRPSLAMFAVSGVIAGLASDDRTPPQALLMPAETGDPASPIEVARTSVAPNGRFIFPRVPPGRYVVHVVQFPHPPPQPGTSMMLQSITSPDGFGMVGMSSQPVAPMDSSPTLCVDLPVVVDDRDVVGLTGAARPAGRVIGQVVFEGTAPKPSGAAFNRAAIIVMTEEARSLASFQLARIEADGTFTTAALPAGKYSLMPMPQIPSRNSWPAPVWGPEWTVTSTSVAGRPSATGAIDLGAADLTGVAITMGDRAIDLSGVLRDAAGKPRSDGSVYAFPTDRQAWTTAGFNTRVLEIRPARSGAYHLTRGMPGDYYVAAALAGRRDWRDRASLEALANSAVIVRLGAGVKTVLDLTAMK